MLRNALLLLCLISASSVISQKNTLKAGIGTGSVPYEGTLGYSFELQYEYRFIPTFSGFLSAGINGDRFVSGGRSSGSNSSGAWDNRWEYTYSEQIYYADAGLKYQILHIGGKYKLKAAAGFSLAHSVFHYPENLVINQGIIVQKDDVTRRANVGMMLLGLENQFQLNDRTGIHLSLQYRTAFDDKHVLTRETRTDSGLGSTTSGIRSVVNALLQFGYLF